MEVEHSESHVWSSFDGCMVHLFGKRVKNKIKRSIGRSPEDLKKNKLMVSYDDLISIWNAGVSHGVEGMKIKK